MFKKKKNRKNNKKVCPNCGTINPVTEIRCSKCGNWYDKNIFHRLSQNDINVIEKNDLLIITPHLLSLMMGKLLKRSLKLYFKKFKEKQLRIEESLLLTYSYSQKLNSIIRKEEGCENSISNQIVEEFICLAVWLYRYIEKNKFIDFEKSYEYGFSVYKNIYNIILDSSKKERKPGVVLSNNLCKLVYGEEATIMRSMYVTILFGEGRQCDPNTFSRFFLIKENNNGNK